MRDKIKELLDVVLDATEKCEGAGIDVVLRILPNYNGVEVTAFNDLNEMVFICRKPFQRSQKLIDKFNQFLETI